MNKTDFKDFGIFHKQVLFAPQFQSEFWRI